MTPVPPIALTCGEPAGVGPELAGLAWRALRQELNFFYIGDPRHLPADLPILEISTADEAAKAMPDGLPVMPHEFAGANRPGKPDPINALQVVEVIERAVGLVQTGQASALCTNPIHKKALQDGANFAFPGHTEFLAHLAGTDRAVMMLASDTLKVVPATIHIALSEVPKALTAELLRATIEITNAALVRDFGIAQPRLAVAGLNPHAGEGGAMGTEELTLIGPLLDQLRAEGMTIAGPLSADTMFHDRARETYDTAIAMYHDQALIPIKTLAFDEGVNITLGLPFIRTSPDHGTAFDIAGKGIARPNSLIAALRMADRMARGRAT